MITIIFSFPTLSTRQFLTHKGNSLIHSSPFLPSFMRLNALAVATAYACCCCCYCHCYSIAVGWRAQPCKLLAGRPCHWLSHWLGQTATCCCNLPEHRDPGERGLGHDPKGGRDDGTPAEGERVLLTLVQYCCCRILLLLLLFGVSQRQPNFTTREAESEEGREQRVGSMQLPWLP